MQPHGGKHLLLHVPERDAEVFAILGEEDFARLEAVAGSDDVASREARAVLIAGRGLMALFAVGTVVAWWQECIHIYRQFTHDSRQKSEQTSANAHVHAKAIVISLVRLVLNAAQSAPAPILP